MLEANASLLPTASEDLNTLFTQALALKFSSENCDSSQ